MNFLKTICLTLAVVSFAGFSAQAQNSSELEHMINPKPAQQDPAENIPQTAAEMANNFFTQCVGEKKPFYSPETQEYMCGCEAAKITDFMTLDDIKNLSKDTRAGSDARAKFIINAHMPCMLDATPDIVMDECRKNSRLDKVLFGKKKICECTAEAMQEFFEYNAGDLALMATKYEPMTTDILHFFLMGQEYPNKIGYFFDNCYNANANKKDRTLR
jgi:hypothetical protein